METLLFLGYSGVAKVTRDSGTFERLSRLGTVRSIEAEPGRKTASTLVKEGLTRKGRNRSFIASFSSLSSQVIGLSSRLRYSRCILCHIAE